MRVDVNPDGTWNVPYETPCMHCGAMIFVASEFVETECPVCGKRYLGVETPINYPRNFFGANPPRKQ